MIKRLQPRILLVFLLLGIGSLYAQELKINFENERSVSEVKANNFERTEFTFAFEGLNYFNVKTDDGTFTELVMPGGYSVGEFGTPKLPARKKLIEVPFGADVEVEVISYTAKEYRLADFGVDFPIMPVQPSLRKDQDPADVPFELQSDFYTRTSYIEPDLAHVEVIGTMRGQRLGRLTIAPIQYNPVEGKIKVYNDVEVIVHYRGADEQLTREIKASTWSPYFNTVYNKVINPFDTRDIFDDHPDLTKNPIKMVVVGYEDFEETLQPFIEWKTKQGFEVIEAYTDDIGSTPSNIQSFIHDQYNDATPEDPAPTFVVIAGDHSNLPASATGSASGRVTDLYYASVDGDQFPEMYLGRLSARTVQELQNQIDKILYYQKYEFTDPSYLNDVTMIAGSDAHWNPNVGQPTVHYATDNYFNAANGFANVNTYLTNYSGSYDEERISVSLINFTAHCSSTSWAGPTLTVNDVHNMTNTGKYPLAIGNCCQSALFSIGESIGEAWVRAEEKGAVAYVGSAPNTHWFEDFYWAVGAFPISGNNNGYVPTVDETTMGVYDAQFDDEYNAVASVKFVGNLAITEAHLQNYPTHSNDQWYWEGYQTFGDPSTVIYFTEGQENNVTHMPIVPIGLDYYTVEAEPGSYVGISMDGVLHGASFVDETGEVDVPLEPILDGGDVTIVVTKPQHIPYIEQVPAAALEGPFVVMDEYTINDPHGTQQANYGESFTIDLTLHNVGADPVDEVTATLIGEDDYITLLDGDQDVTFDPMEAGETNNSSTVADAFSFEVSMNVPDEYQTTFELHVTDGEESWTSNLRITAYAPIFSINPDFIIDDSEHGNGDGQLDPGEQGLLIFELSNDGHAIAREPLKMIDADSPYFTIAEEELELDPLPAGDTVQVIFYVEAHPSTIEGSLVNLELFVEDGHHDELHTELYIGQLPEMTIGEGTDVPGNYPFYNYYKANRSQMLYTIDEIGPGEKTIVQMGMDVVHATSTSEHQVLPNFKIMIKHTDMEQLGTSFESMSDATVVKDVNEYQMATDEGWHYIDIDAFDYDGSSNLIIEIVWGLLPTWCSFGDQYQVNGTTMESTRAVFGYSDTQAIPSYSGNSNILPNLFLEFEAEEPEDVYSLTFNVNDEDNNMLENVRVTIGSLTRLTDEEGSTAFTLVGGEYQFSASKENFSQFNNTVDLQEDMVVDVTLTSGGIPVTFMVDLSNAMEHGLLEGFDHNADHIMITGDMLDWVEPGTDMENQVMELVSEDPPVYGIEFQLEPGTYEYKYFSDFLGDGWEGGEWAGDPNRSVEVGNEEMTVENMFGPDDLSVVESGDINMLFYPNPASSELTIQSNERINRVQITDILGQVVHSARVDNQQMYTVGVNHLKPGMYLIQVTTSQGVITSSIQVTH